MTSLQQQMEKYRKIQDFQNWPHGKNTYWNPLGLEMCQVNVPSRPAKRPPRIIPGAPADWAEKMLSKLHGFLPGGFKLSQENWMCVLNQSLKIRIETQRQSLCASKPLFLTRNLCPGEKLQRWPNNKGLPSPEFHNRFTNYTSHLYT